MLKTEVKNILISNIYSWQNKGDAAIVISMLKEIKSQFPNAHLTLSSRDPNDFGKYGDYEYTENILNFVHRKNYRPTIQLILLLWFLVRLNLFNVLNKFTGIKIYCMFGDKLSNKIRLYEQYDLIIACGGGYMLTESAKNIINKYLFWHDYYIGWKLFGTAYLLYNQSIGPFHNGFHLFLATPLLKNAKKIFCREKLSFERLKKNNLKNCFLCSDIAFKLTSIKSNLLTEKYNYDSNAVNIGITVRKWLDQNSQARYEEAITQFIEKLVMTDIKCEFYFMPQVIFSGNNDNDLNVTIQIYRMLSDKAKKKTKIVEEDLHPSKLKYLISKMNYFVGTRMHSNIFAMTSNVRTIAIAYEPKTKGIMIMLGLKQYVINMHNVTTVILFEMFEKLKNDTDYMTCLKKNMKKITMSTTYDLKKIIS